ncbi:uncharacterized protein LOC127105772 [Lathyrus oleraceus]|uniref:uncharacterized protein LOC127105772 n=1 Tax=Pisum sativum TaxID=3888 RepID=UPI0021CF1735|nr:uncharacterized protein LOC127105772 [Pisum sativum]
MVEYLRDNPEKVIEEVDRTRGAHARFEFLSNIYVTEIQRAEQADGDAKQAWILQHFPHIAGWASMPEYTKIMSRVSVFIPLRGNQAIDPFRVYLDHLVVEDVHFNNYVDHRQTGSFDEIILYSGWLLCGSRFTAPHLPERVMWQFGYKEARDTIAENDWSYVEGYTKWFFKVSHPYMVHAALEDPSRPAYQEILENE